MIKNKTVKEQLLYLTDRLKLDEGAVNIIYCSLIQVYREGLKEGKK